MTDLPNDTYEAIQMELNLLYTRQQYHTTIHELVEGLLSHPYDTRCPMCIEQEIRSASQP